ncbi:MAG: threonylcarbamoyl-AMP synthase [Phycisphaerales bacterium]|nr:threonylcarbamoyl-AMP synthase [Phycisphaerales bacterium]
MHVSEELVDAASARLRDGGVIAFPTETVYGLGVDARNPDAVERVYELKGRPPVKPLSVLVDGVEAARRLVTAWPAAAARLADAFWPGPLTIVLPRVMEGPYCLPGVVVAGGDTVGLRCPDHALTLAILGRFGGPVAGPSANRSGEAEPTTAGAVRTIFGDPQAVLVVDGGTCRVGRASTVIRVHADDTIEILRDGAIPEAAVRGML